MTVAGTNISYTIRPTTGRSISGSESEFSLTGSGSAHQHNMSANFSGDSTSVLQPYLTVIYIIKT